MMNGFCVYRKTNKMNLIHGMCGTKVYKSWESMKARCLNKNTSGYENYGGRGITVCDEWLGKNGFINFYKDMGERPKGKTLDRIENNKGYYKKNCKWSTYKEQQNNTRRNHFLTYKGKTQTIAQWARESKISYFVIDNRINKFNWNTERTLETKVGN